MKNVLFCKKATILFLLVIATFFLADAQGVLAANPGDPCGYQNRGQCFGAVGIGKLAVCPSGMEDLTGGNSCFNWGTLVPLNGEKNLKCCVANSQRNGLCGGKVKTETKFNTTETKITGGVCKTEQEGCLSRGSKISTPEELLKSQSLMMEQSDLYPRCETGLVCCNPIELKNAGSDAAAPSAGSDASAPSAGSDASTPSVGAGAVALGAGLTAPVLIKIPFSNPLNQNTVEGVAGQLLSYIQAVVVIVAMIFLIIAGILYITSAGDERRMENAKKAMTAAIIGLGVILAAPSFLREIYTVLGGSTNDPLVAPALGLRQIANNVLTFLLSIVGFLAIIGLVVGGLMYILAMGDEKRAETAKKIFRTSVIGIVVAMSALLIVQTISKIIAGR